LSKRARRDSNPQLPDQQAERGIENAQAGPIDSAFTQDHPTTNPTKASGADLTLVVTAWQSLPHAIRAGIVAMVIASGAQGQ